jgi:hypothetical protein
MPPSPTSRSLLRRVLRSLQDFEQTTAQFNSGVQIMSRPPDHIPILIPAVGAQSLHDGGAWNESVAKREAGAG